MIAYNKIWLDNLASREAIQDAFYGYAISKEEKDRAESNFPVGFYSPNIFIRIGLLILTLVIACFSFGLLCLLFLDSITHSIEGLTLFFGLMAYGALEFFIREKHHYRSGVDDALLCIAGICLVTGISLLGDLSAGGTALLIFVLSAYFFLRFTDMLMSAIAGLALLAVVFFYYSPMGSIAKATTPFLLMAVAALIYFLIKTNSQKKDIRHYRHGSAVLEISMLICFYAAGNFYVVRELSNSMFDLGLKENENIPYAWLFWLFTIVIPLVYIFAGVKKKDSVLLRVGLIAIAAIVFTVRYYHTVLALETAMLVGGTILIAVSYTIANWLARPKNGFTSEELSKRDSIDKMNIEALLIAETFDGTVPENDTKFGGGSFGGGGASGEY